MRGLAMTFLANQLQNGSRPSKVLKQRSCVNHGQLSAILEWQFTERIEPQVQVDEGQRQGICRSLR
jgi:hypothetical protein